MEGEGHRLHQSVMREMDLAAFSTICASLYPTRRTIVSITIEIFACASSPLLVLFVFVVVEEGSGGRARHVFATIDTAVLHLHKNT